MSSDRVYRGDENDTFFDAFESLVEDATTGLDEREYEDDTSERHQRFPRRKDLGDVPRVSLAQRLRESAKESE